MNIINKTLLGGALLLGASTTMASPITKGGVTWDPAAGSDFTASANVYESFVSAVGGYIEGYGEISKVNGLTQSEFCTSCELTYTFKYQLVSSTSQVVYFNGTDTVVGDITQTWDSVNSAILSAPSGPTITLSSGTNLTTSVTPADVATVAAWTGSSFDFIFDSGSLDVYVDTNETFDDNAPLKAAAEDGVLWLSMVNNGTLTGSASDLFDITKISGKGTGYLDVTGGLAMSNFDTNAFVSNNDADMQFTSSFDINTAAQEAGFPLTGSSVMQGVSIPEPTSLALLGLGLLGLGANRKSK